MKIRKLLLTLVSAATLFAFGSQAASASTWSKGTPAVLHGTWKSKVVTIKGYKSSNGETKITNSSIFTSPRFNPVDPQSISGLKYKSLGSGKYTVTGTDHTNGTTKLKFHFHVINKNKIYFSGVRDKKDYKQFSDAAYYYRS